MCIYLEHYSAPQHEKFDVHDSFIRPHLEYCIQAWRPFYHKSFAVLERTFRSFTKRCPETASLPYLERLKVLGLRSLQARFDRGDLLQTFKIGSWF